MNRISIVQKSILAALLIAMLLLTLSVPVAAAPGVGWLSLWTWVNSCTWTVKVEWAGLNGAKTLEVYVTETYIGSPLVPTFVPVNSKSGIATVTLPPLAPSSTSANFYAWGQMLDAHGDVIPGSRDFGSVQTAYCTSP